MKRAKRIQRRKRRRLLHFLARVESVRRLNPAPGIAWRTYRQLEKIAAAWGKVLAIAPEVGRIEGVRFVESEELRRG